MTARVALCVDEATCRNPEIIGLDGEMLDSQEWLAVYTAGNDARRGIAEDEGLAEAWVVSSNDVEPINLAATLKADRPGLHVALVTFESNGSLFSRAHTALIDEVVDRAQFLRRYADMKPGFKQQEHRSDHARTLPNAPIATAGRAFLLPVVSGSGGAGKSSVSVMGAHIAQSMGHRTLLLDYDLQFGDAALMAGFENALAIDEAIARPDQLARELKQGSLTVLAAPARLEAADAVVRAMPQFLDDVSSSFDVIVANTGAAWAEQHAALLERCSAALFLVDQRASSVRACRHALELCARCGIASGPFQFALNRCSKNAPLTSADVSCALDGAPVFELKDGGRDVEDYLGAGASAELLETRNEFCTSLEYVMSRVLPSGSVFPDWNIAQEKPRVQQRKRGRHVGRKRGRGIS